MGVFLAKHGEANIRRPITRRAVSAPQGVVVVVVVGGGMREEGIANQSPYPNTALPLFLASNGKRTPYPRLPVLPTRARFGKHAVRPTITMRTVDRCSIN